MILQNGLFNLTLNQMKMNANKIYREVLIGSVVLAPLIYLMFLWNTLPIQIPIHFDGQGNPDGYGTKGNLVLIISFLSVGVYLLLLYIPKIDPKKNFSIFSSTYVKLRVILSLFFSVICFIIIFSVRNSELNTLAFYFMFALLFSLMGNYMSNIRPNYFIGLRTPWALEDELNWKKTHFITGRIWFIAGIVLGISMLVLPIDYRVYIFLSVLFVISIFPVIYSFYHFKKHSKKAKN